MRKCVVCDAPMAGCNGSPVCFECLDAGVIVHNFGIYNVVVTDSVEPNQVFLKSGDGHVLFDGVMYDASTHDPSHFTEQSQEDPHYKDMAIEPNDFITANNLGWCEGNIVKYICRHKLKGGADDIRKIIRYAEYILANEYGQNASGKVAE